MDAEEMARKRAEMMDNAKSRDEQRKERVMQYTVSYANDFTCLFVVMSEYILVITDQCIMYA